MEKKMELNSDEFMKTEVGEKLKDLIPYLDKLKRKQWKKFISREAGDFSNEEIRWLDALWGAYKLSIEQFYGVKLNYESGKDSCGIFIDTYNKWLFKVDITEDAEENK